MKIFVCVKQVPDTRGKAYIKKDGSLDRAKMSTIINPDDLGAVETALRLKEKLGAEKIIAVTMGPPMASVMMLLVAFLAVPAYATGGNVSGAIEGTWNAAQGQIKDIVNNVVFPVIDMILAVLLFVKIATAYMDYRKHGQFEFTAPAILFACLLFSLTAPSYIWNIL